MKKYLLSLLFLLPMLAGAQNYQTTVDGITYTNYGGYDAAVMYSSNLTGDVVIPKTVKFTLNRITYTWTVRKIYSKAFSGCKAQSIFIPNTITYIQSGAFNYNKLASIVLEEGNTAYDSRDNCNAIIETATNHLVSGCMNTVIPNTVTSIGEDAFNGCEGLLSISIPNSVNSIGIRAFAGCYGLTSVTIPKSVTTIENYAFISCSNLTSVISESETPVAIAASAFYNCEKATLYVPKGSKAAYEAATGWNEFKNIAEIGATVEGIAIDETNFPDANFRSYLLEQDYGKDGVITESEIQEISVIFVEGRGVHSLKGIEFFTALKTLFCGSNQLTSLDVSKNTALSLLSCYTNQLTALDVSKNTALTNLNCSNNQLTSLDLSKNTALEELYSSDNQLTSLDVSKNTAISFLSCYSNKLTALDVSQNTELGELRCYSNKLTSLDVSKNTALTKLSCDKNQLTSLNVSNCAALTYLNCSSNQLTSLNALNCTALTSLNCYINQLTTLDVSNCTSLEFLSCSRNKISGKNMDDLINSLPQNENTHTFYLINNNKGDEENVCTKSQVAVAKAKGWTPQYYDETAGKWTEYEGSDDDIASGTAEMPFTCAQAIDFVSKLTADQKTDVEYYVKGKVSSVRENYGTKYGDATFYISDDGSENGQFLVYRSLYFNGEKYLSGRVPNYGDEVVLCGKLVNYRGITPETADKDCRLVSLNGKTAGLPLENNDLFVAQSTEGVDVLFVKSSNTCTVGYATPESNVSYDVLPSCIDPKYEGTVTIPEQVEGMTVNTVAPYAFVNSKLSAVTVPSGVYDIESYAFSGCSKLSSVVMPKDVILNDGTFMNCTSLASVELPEGVKLWGGNVEIFSGCSLYSVTVNDMRPSELSNKFVDDPGSVILYVPKGSKAAYEAAEYWKDFMDITEIVSPTDISILDNVIYMDATEVRTASQATLSLKMKNKVQISAFQFDLSLPEGVTVVKNSRGMIQGALNDGRLYEGDDHTLTISELEDGIVRVVCASSSSLNFVGNEGEIATLKVNIADDMIEGDYAIRLKDIKLVKDNGDKLYTELVQSKLTVVSYIPGDANGDGEVDVADVVAIVNYILEKPADNFNFKAADVNDDNEIDAADVVSVVNIILDKGNVNAARVREVLRENGFIF